MTDNYQEIAQKLNLPVRVQGYDQLVEHVAEHVRAIMAQNPEKLFQMFYLLDVSEAKVSRAIDRATPATVHSDLAKLIIERELQKIKARK